MYLCKILILTIMNIEIIRNSKLRNNFLVTTIMAFAFTCVITFNAKAQETMIDSGLDYTESTQEVKNPFMGFVNKGYASDGSFWLTETGTSTVHVNSGFVWYYVNLQKFSAGNSPNVVPPRVGGVDKPIADTALKAFAKALETLRQNGGSAMLRFVYDFDGIAGCEPADFNMILTHIRQLGEVMSNYDDIILAIECGIIGKFGEMHSSIYTGSYYSNQIIDAYLDNTPETIRLLVRTPAYIANYLGVNKADLKNVVTVKGTKAYRLGMYNDGYMNTVDDLGTWTINRAEEIKFLFSQNNHAPYGGEFGSAYDASLLPNNACIPENAIPEMYQSHLSYLHSNIYKISDKNKIFGYDQYTYGSEYEKSWYSNNTAFYGMTCHDFIRAHIGYRLVLRESKLSAVPRLGQALKLSGYIENTGFANILHCPSAQVIMVQMQNGDTTIHIFDVKLDASDFISCIKYKYDLSLSLPNTLSTGDYDIYLRLAGSNGKNIKATNGIRFANNGEIFNVALGANKLGSVKIHEAVGIDVIGDVGSIKIYPNPVSIGQTLYINFEDNTTNMKDAVIDVLDVTGRCIETINVESEQMQISIDATKYVAGTYLVVLKGKDNFKKEYKLLVR